MGTLFDQPPRQESLSQISAWICIVGTELGFNMKKPDDVHAACDIIRTALAVQSADVLDEQLSGFGHLLSEYANEKEST